MIKLILLNKIPNPFFDLIVFNICIIFKSIILKQYKVKKVDVKDTSGAGDSFMAALVVNYLKNNDIDKAIKYANDCASEVVKHRGVSLI